MSKILILCMLISCNINNKEYTTYKDGTQVNNIDTKNKIDYENKRSKQLTKMCK